MFAIELSHCTHCVQWECVQWESSIATTVFVIHSVPSEKRERNNSVPIHYGSVRCSGEQDSLLECPLSENTDQCTHDQDAAIVCRRGRSCKYILG